MGTFSRALAAALLGSLVAMSPATAQTGSRLGPSFTAIGPYVRGSAVAYDSKSSVYLVVAANGPVNGRFVTSEGQLVGSQFVIHNVGLHNSFPQVGYSPDANGGAGGFLVTWHQSDIANGATPHARIVSYSAGNPVIGADVQLVTDGSWWEAGAMVAYSTVSKEFLVTWQAAGIRAQRIGNTGQKLGGQIFVTSAAYHRDPTVTYNPTTNEFLVVYSGEDSVSPFVAARRVAPVSGALLGTATLLNRASATYLTEAVYNSATNRYLAAWYQIGGSYGRLLDSAGIPVSGVLPLSTRFSSYDALGIDYNRVSGTFMLVSHDTAGRQDGAVELSAQAIPDGIGFIATNTAAAIGNFYPQIAARSDAPQWLLSTATDFVATTVQRLQSSARGSGPPGAATLRSPSGQSGTATPSFTWNAVSSATHYQLWVTDSSGLGRVQQWYTAAAAGCGGVCTIRPGVTLGAGAAVWWVRTWNTSGYGPWSSGMTFTVPPAPATLLSPQGTITPPAPTFTWNAVSGATYYYLWVTDTSGQGRIQQWYPSSAAGCGSGTGICTASPGVTLGAGAAVWWVLTWSDTGGYGPWSPGASFIVAATAAPTRLVGTVVGSPSVRYTWNALSGATWYQLWVTDSTGTPRVQEWFTSTVAGCGSGGTCMFQWSVSMSSGTAYFWVQAWGPATGYSPWSNPGTFLFP